MEQACTQQQGAKFLLLTGAPRCKDLLWAETDLTVKLQPPFQADDEFVVIDPSSDHFPAWRELHLNPRSFHTGFSQCHYPVFFRGTDIPENEDISAHGAKSISANAAEDSFMSESLSRSALESFRSTLTISSHYPDPLLRCVHVSDLSKLPAAHQLTELTQYRSNLVNLLVLILTIPSLQTVQIKKSGLKREADLIRLLVGDETYANFEMSIWLDHVDQKETKISDRDDPRSLGDMAMSLQKHDIVLIQNIALRAFQNKVGASSIRGLTEIKLLYRDYPTIVQHKLPLYPVGMRMDPVSGDGISAKITKILQWRDAFLDIPTADIITRSKRRRLEQNNQPVDTTKTKIRLPADTQ